MVNKHLTNKQLLTLPPVQLQTATNEAALMTYTEQNLSWLGSRACLL